VLLLIPISPQVDVLLLPVVTAIRFHWAETLVRERLSIRLIRSGDVRGALRLRREGVERAVQRGGGIQLTGLVEEALGLRPVTGRRLDPGARRQGPSHASLASRPRLEEIQRGIPVAIALGMGLALVALFVLLHDQIPGGWDTVFAFYALLVVLTLGSYILRRYPRLLRAVISRAGSP
jgi:hypothetical protein